MDTPFFGCRNQGCAENVTYAEDDLRLHPSGEPICEFCWEDEQKVDDPKFYDLPAFESTQTQEITRLREENRRLKSGYQKDLEHVISKIAKMAADSPELNMLNYTQDQVSDLNESMIEVCLFAEEVTGRICEGQSIKDLLARAALKGGE